MKKIDRIQAENFLKSRKIHKNLRRVIALLAAFVMLFTVNTLKRNANTLSRYPMCGMDEHIHGASCFDEAGNLICLIPEHEHTDACYQESPDYVPEELEIDLPVDDEGTEPEDDIPEDGYVELGAEEIKPFNLEAPVLLSEMVASMGMNVDLSRVVQVGAVENDDAHSGMVAAEPLDGDWRISSLRSFNDAELAVITTDDILIIPLTAGAPETPEAPEAPEAPAEPEPVEGDGLDEGAPADENVATDGNDAGDENQTEVGSEETGDGNVEQEQTEVSTGDAENTGDETEIETTGDENKENEVEQPVEEVIEQPIENVVEQPIENVTEQPVENVAEQVAENTDNNEAGQVAVDAPEQPAEENADDQQVEEVKEVEVELGGDDETQQADDDATEQGDDVEQTVEGGETEQTVEGDETEQTVEGGETEQTVEGDETEQTVEGDETEQTVEGDETEQTVEGDETEQSDEDDEIKQPADENDETKEEAQPAEVVTAQIEADTDNNEEVEKIEADEADKSDEAEDKADEETADEADKSDEAGKSDEAEDKSDDETADEAEKSDEDAEKADEAEKSDEDAEKADEDTEKSDEEGDETDEDADLEDEQGEDAEQGDEIGDEEGDEANETTDGEATEVAAPSVSVTVDLSSVDLMDSASIEADTVKLSVADLLTGADDAVEVNGDLVVDNETFAAAADVTAAENVDVQDGVITLSAEALETGVVVLEISTVTQPEAQPEAQSAPAEDAEPAAEGEPAEDAEPVEAAEPEPVVTTQTVEIQLTGYTGRTTDDIGDEGQQVTITPADGNSLPADATANVEQVEAPEELKAPEEPQENVLQDAVAYEITITNANNDEISETGEVAVKLNTPDLNVLEGLPEGTEADKVHLELIHIDDDGNATPVENAMFDHDPVTGEVRSVSFTTESFSTYVVRYTVDFTYVDEAGEEHFWQFPGTGSRALREVLSELGIKGETITEATLKMTKLVGECGDKDLYLTQEEETGEWFIHSEAAFDDTYELTMTVDGTEYVVTVTDAAGDSFHTVTVNISEDVTLPQNVYVVLAQTGITYTHSWGATIYNQTQYHLKKLTNETVQTYTAGTFVIEESGTHPNPYDNTKTTSAYLVREASYGTINSESDLVNNAGNIVRIESFGDYGITVNTENNETTITIGDVGPVVCTASVAFYDAWSDTPNESPTLSSGPYTLVGTDAENHTYTATISGPANPITFTDNNSASVTEIPEISSWKLNGTALSSETPLVVDGYNWYAPERSGRVYTFEARQPNTYSAQINFKDANGDPVASPDLGGTYTVKATKDGDSTVYTATISGNGTLNWSAPLSGTVLPKISEFKFYNSGNEEVSKLGEYVVSVASMDDNDLVGGVYVINAKLPLMRGVSLGFVDQDETAPDSVALDANYYVVATVNGAQYYHTVTGAEKASETIAFLNGSGETVTTLPENATFELRKSTSECADLSAVLAADSVSAFQTSDGKTYTLGEAVADGATYALTATEYVPNSKIDNVSIQLLDASGTTPTKPSQLPNGNLYILATLKEKGASNDEVKGWTILKVNNDDFNNNNGVSTNSLENAKFYFKPDGNNWSASSENGYNDSLYDIDVKLYRLQDNIGNDASAYNNLMANHNKTDVTESGLDSYIYMGATNDGGTYTFKLRRYEPKTYGLRAYLTAPGQAIAETDYYAVRVIVSYNDGYNNNKAIAVAKLVVNGNESSTTPVDLEFLKGTRDNKSTIWYEYGASGWVNLDESKITSTTIEVLEVESSSYFSNEYLRKTASEGHYTVIPATTGSVKGYTWTQGARETGEPDERGTTCTYDVIRLAAPEGTLSASSIREALRDATNFGLYTELLSGHHTDMEANIGAAVVNGPVTDGYGFSSNNIFINQIKVTKRWTGDDVNHKYVKLRLYPVVGYDENSGAYTGLGTPQTKDGYTDENGLLEITFSKLAPGYYLLKEVLDNGDEVSFESGANGVVSLGGNKKVSFADGLLKIENINVNVNYFGSFGEKMTDSALKDLLKNSRRGWVVTDGEDNYNRLNSLNNQLNEGDRSFVGRTGTSDYPLTYNIPSDMSKLRTLSEELATAGQSQTVKIIPKNLSEITAGSINIQSDGKFVVMNITVDKSSPVVFEAGAHVDGVELKADFGAAGSEYASKVLYNFIKSDGTPYDGELKTGGEGSGILFAPAAKVTHLGGNWGGTIVCREADHTGSEIHSDSANKTRKINTSLTNSDKEENNGDLRLEKKTIGDTVPDNTTWFTFKVTLKQADDTTPVTGIFSTTTQSDGSKSITFDAKGEATIQVRANNNIIIYGLPMGAHYTVEEQFDVNSNHYELGWYENKDGERKNTGTIAKGETVIARAVNVRKVGGLTVTKRVVGDETNAKKFTFKVTILNNEGTAPDTSFTGAYGSMVFTAGVATFSLGNGEYCTAKDIPTGTKFKVEEIDHDQNGFATICDVTVTGANASIVTKNDTDKFVTGEIVAGNGTEPVIIAVAYTNTHTNEATYSPKVTKVLQQIGEDPTAPVKWPAEGFTFTLAADSNNNSTEKLGATTATATKDSPIASFGAITYKAAGTYQYTITETVPGGVDAHYKKDGITYQTTPVTVTVNVICDNVTDPEHPTYKISSVQYGGCEAVMNNIAILFASGSVTNDYESVEATPKAQKVLNGVAFNGKRSDGTTKATFTFDLKEVNNNGGSLEVGNTLQTVSTGDDGLVSFEALDYIVPGVHIYEISERQGSEPRIRYDDTKVYWKVVVDGTGGKLHISDGYYSDISCGDQYKLTDDYAAFRNNELTKVHLHKSWYLNGQAAPNDYSLPEYIQVKLWRKGSESAEVVDLTGKPLPEDSLYDSSSNVLTLKPITKTVDGQAYLYWTWDIDGLDAYYNGTSHPYEYYFEEVSVPDGWTVVYSNEENGTYDPTANTKAIVGGGNFYMRNSRYTAQLPATGGVGTTAVYVGGSGLLLLAILGWLLSARKRRE